jgi:hypothetical protein
MLSPVLGFLIADGHLNFGAGEKDLFLLVPWMAWSALYLVVFIILWIMRKSTGMIMLYAVCGATILLGLAAAMLFLFAPELLGVRGV